MKKIIIIFGVVIFLLISLFIIFTFVLPKDIAYLNQSERNILNIIGKNLSLDKDHVQVIPENYTIIGIPRGLYYKSDGFNLIELWLYDLNIKDIPSEISSFRNLKMLKVINTNIENLKVVDDFQKLEVLDLNNNKINKIDEMDNLPNLKRLNLSNNNLTKIEGLDNLKNLEYLDLEGNKINLIENLELSTNELTFNTDELKITQQIRLLKKLKKINLKNNPITCDILNIAEIHKLESREIEILSDCD